MKALWNKAFELLREHLVLWVPCLIAGILMLVLGRLNRAEVHLLLKHFATQHSVLGGDVASGDPVRAQHQAMMIIYPLGFLERFLKVFVFVVALVSTKNLVQMIIENQRPDVKVAVRGFIPRWREVLLFSIKYMAIVAVFGGFLIVLTTSPLTSERFHEIALSKASFFVQALVMEGSLAWLLMPAAIRLLRSPSNPTISTQDRKLGVVFAVATAAGSLVLGSLLGNAETAIVFDSPWEAWAIGVLNSIITNALYVLLFIAIALLAIRKLEEEA